MIEIQPFPAHSGVRVNSGIWRNWRSADRPNCLTKLLTRSPDKSHDARIESTESLLIRNIITLFRRNLGRNLGPKLEPNLELNCSSFKE